jgi:O-antigen/teichoic acid export membrane protein
VKIRPLPRISALRGGGAVLVALVGWNASNYAFLLLAGRLLGPSDYGLVAALLAAVLVASVPAQALQFAAARLVAAARNREVELADGIYRRAWRRCAEAMPTAALAACTVIVTVHVTSHHVPLGPLVATVGLVLPLGLYFLSLGRLQGEERFAAFSTCFALWGVPRPIVFVPLAALGLGVYAALGATGAALAAALAASMLFTRGRSPGREPSLGEWRAFTRRLMPMVVGLLALGVITNLDVIVAKIVLSPHDAGQFAATAALAKAVFLVPQAVSFVLVPRVAARAAAAQDTGLLVGLGLGVTLAVGGLASLIVGALADPLLRVTYGSDFTGSAALLGAYAGASTLLGALIVLVYHHVARADRFVWGAAALAVLQAVLFLGLHSSQKMIVAVDAVVGATGLIMHECMFFRTEEAIVPGFVRAVRRARELRHAA